MRFFFLLLLPVAIWACSNSQAQPSPVTKIEQPAAPEISDTCFYTIHVPPDLDVPTTPAFDTTIVRSENCSVHILRLPSWGTETEYHLNGTVNGKTFSRGCHFYHGAGSGRNMIDITDLPAGSYGMSLLACGNGGGFTLNIK